MRNITILFVAVALACSAAVVAIAAEEKAKEVAPVLNFTMDSLDGKPVALSKYQGKVVMMVNVASKCGNTKQYKPLQALHEKYADKGLAILGFPANDFNAQEPGSSEDIAAFCEKNYGVKFDMFSKIVVKGDGQHPLYKFLTAQETAPQPAGEIKWNFEKFLIGKDGKVAARFAPKTQPDSEEVVKAIEAELAK
ncbi:MAG: glutathione peroxidase [Tepidisphaeraceae bacterium]